MLSIGYGWNGWWWMNFIHYGWKAKFRGQNLSMMMMIMMNVGDVNDDVDDDVRDVIHDIRSK